ncbi:MAG TPA: SGNH hydrolase domain-containing protein, partial [Acidimicrobiia bacterium]|nr:SGNH hydrolase domain-containing protein [Acidimicrobiia bacterium]
MQRRGANELDRAAPGIRRRVVAFAAVLVVLAAGCGSSSKDTAPTEKVLLIGDSIMDQEGGAAALALRQAGVDAEKIAFWGSGLLTADQYDHGKTRLDGPRPGSEDIHWLSKAKELVAKDRPRLVVVSMNHNLHSPYPTTADGREIKDPASPEAHVMIQTQVRALLEILRKHGAKVAFVTPPPDKDEFKPEDNPIWRSIKPVLDEEHIPIIDIAPAVSHNGARVEALPDCFGREQKIRRINEPHYERFGAGLAGTALADGIAKLLGEKLDNGAPGEHPVALVSTESGEGYWIVQ